MIENNEYRFKIFKNYNYSNSTGDNTDPEIAEVLDDSKNDEPVPNSNNKFDIQTLDIL